MRRAIFILAAAALFSVGATSSTDCLSSLLPVLTPRVSISVHVINDAYQAVTAELQMGIPGNTNQPASVVGLLAASDTTDGDGNDGENSETGTTVAPGEDSKIGTLLCGTVIGPISLKVTYKDSSNTEVSATSPELYLDNDFACGDRVNFIIRPAAMVGVVVGYEVESGSAD